MNGQNDATQNEMGESWEVFDPRCGTEFARVGTERDAIELCDWHPFLDYSRTGF
jgi:hypothetical protein